MDDNIKLIQFIDSQYRELFKIPDGGKIKITYPPEDGREPVIRECKHLGSHHFETKGSGGDCYHICQFAEIMEKLGAKYEPVNQLLDVELLPYTKGEEKFYTYNREKNNTCVGHISADFGNDGDRFYSNWSDRENGKNSIDFQTELQSAVYALRQGILKDLGSMIEYCQGNPDAKLPDTGDCNVYGFKLETDSRQFYVRCYIAEIERDSRVIIYAYDKPEPVIEKAVSIVEEVKVRKPTEKPSVLDQVKAPPQKPKQPSKAKTQNRKRELLSYD